MGEYSFCARDSYYGNSEEKSKLFILSDVNTEFLRKHNINISVAKFKDIVRKKKPFSYVWTGNIFNQRRTPVYNINDFITMENISL